VKMMSPSCTSVAAMRSILRLVIVVFSVVGVSRCPPR
jgi:hypothetical protein